MFEQLRRNNPPNTSVRPAGQVHVITKDPISPYNHYCLVRARVKELGGTRTCGTIVWVMP